MYKYETKRSKMVVVNNFRTLLQTKELINNDV